MSSKCGRMFSVAVTVLSAMSGPPVLHLLLLKSELVDVAVAVAEELGAAGEIPDVPVVHLLGLNRYRFVPAGLEGLRPDPQRSRVMRLQGLDPGHIETRFRRTLFDHLDGRQLSARKDVGHEEFKE